MFLETLFSPKTVCVVGASRNVDSWGHVILKNLINSGYAGSIFAVNPNADSILGVKCHRSLRDVEAPIDLAIIVVPAKLVPCVLNDAKPNMIKYAVVISAGFREAGAEGRQLEKEMIEIARRNGTRIVGPNCMGLYNSYNGLGATFTSLLPREGGVSFISQSGAVGTTMLAWAKIEGIGFSKFISLGNESDISLHEVLRFLADDDSTKVIAIYMESVKDGRQLVEAFRYASERKPVIVMKVGITSAGAKAAESHTGALAVEDSLIDGIFRQFCIIRAKDPDELFHLATSFAELPMPKGRSAVVVSTGGGWAVECSDLAELEGIALPPLPEVVSSIADRRLPRYWSKKNPIDMVATPDPEAYYEILEAALCQGTYDFAFLIGYGTIGSIAMPFITDKEVEMTQRVLRLIERTEKPVYIVDFLGPSRSESARAFMKLGLPVYINVSSAVHVASEMIRYNEYRKKMRK